MNFPELHGAVVPVSGAASGIGLAICKKLRSTGAIPLLLDPDAARLRCAVREVYSGSTDEPDIYGYELDVRDAHAVDACFERVRSDHGRVTHAVANAGVAKGAHILELTDLQWQQVMAVNLHGALHFCRAAARQLVESRGGALVTMSSIAGLMAKADRVAYSSSKAAVVGMTRALALDLGPMGVRVNAIAPGIIDTPLQTHPSFRKPVEERAALRRVGTADEVADVAMFLLSEMSSYMTGQTLLVDGGISVSYI
jgi:NAD(P)-dependent dehydrogenase (short-subunit alcohol dehydrogenase family)